MLSIFKRQNGMTIIGQSGIIFLFTLPFLLISLYLHIYHPEAVTMPSWLSWLRYVGYFLFLPGLLLWGLAVYQLLTAFTKGELVTVGAYGIVRNPIYACVIFFFLPAVACITQTWVYLSVALALYLNVIAFIGKEEAQLHQAFGREYEIYLCSVPRLIPFTIPTV